MSDQAPFQFTCGPTTGCGKAFDVVRSGNGWTLPEVCPHCGQPQHGAGKIFFTSSEPMSRTAQAIAALIGGAGDKGIPQEKLAPMLYMVDVLAREYLGHPITDIKWTGEMLLAGTPTMCAHCGEPLRPHQPIFFTTTGVAHVACGPEYPKACGLCQGTINSADDLEWHGLGNCVAICETCKGAGHTGPIT